MLKTTQAVSRTRSAAADLDVEITGVATALPAYKLSQRQVAKHAGAVASDLRGQSACTAPFSWWRRGGGVEDDVRHCWRPQ